MQTFIALLVISVTLLILFLKYLQTYWSRRGIPHDAPHFPMGNFKGWRKTKHLIDLFTPVYNKYKGTGPFAGFYFLVSPAVVAIDLEFVKNVLIKDFNNFDSRGVFHNEVSDPLTANLFALDGYKWRLLRQKLSPTFTSGKMKFMFPTVVKVGVEFGKVFAEKVATVAATQGGVLEVTDLLARFTADVIGSCAFGLECNSLRNPDAEFVTIGKSVLTERRHCKIIDTFIESFPKISRKLDLAQVPQFITDFYAGVVRETIDYREKNHVKCNDFMNMLIELKNSSENKLTFNEVLAQSFIFFVAGFETSSTTMGFALYELAKDPKVQAKLREEVLEVFKRYNNEFTYECMQDMNYLQQVISETLRKYPILPQLMRVANERYETSDPKYYIDKGTKVIIPIHAIHYDPELYPDPNKFDPDRFTEQEIQKRPACSWLPFGDGPRNCIGLRFGKMQAAIGLAYLIKGFKFSPCERTPSEIHFVKANPLLSAIGGIYLRVEKV